MSITVTELYASAQAARPGRQTERVSHYFHARLADQFDTHAGPSGPTSFPAASPRHVKTCEALPADRSRYARTRRTRGMMQRDRLGIRK
jgi:hypothetical protein